MEEIRNIKGKKEEAAFSELSTYCFPDMNGWTKRIFPLQSGDIAWGMFENNSLSSAVISKPFYVYIFNTITKMAGIANVISSPQHRNRGYIRKLHHKILHHDLEKGMLSSILMPFKFNFYEKFGFGFLGGMINTSFEPNNIKIDPVCEGNWLPFTGNKEHLLDMYDVHDIWVRNFTGGIKSRRLPLARFKEGIKWSKDKLFLYYKNNEYKAYIRFRLNIKSIHVTDIEIRKAAWKDKEGFSGLLHFLKSHRDQCKNIKWQLPNNIPLHLVFKNPRIFQQYQHDYMIRPLDVEKVLRLKAGYTPATEKIAFSIEDPVISDNSGTYIIEGNEVKKMSFNGENRLPFHVFSSLLYGAFSLKEIELTGLTGLSFPITVYSFFQKNNDIYVSETF